MICGLEQDILELHLAAWGGEFGHSSVEFEWEGEEKGAGD